MRIALDRLPRRAVLLAGVVLLGFSFLLAYRAVFWATFHRVGADVPAAELAHALGVGARFDLRLAVLLALPLVALACVRRLDPWGRAGRRLWLGYMGVAWLAVTLLHAVDVGHYEYVQARLNATLVEHVREVSIAAEMVRETYPVAWILLVVAALVAAYLAAARALLRRVGRLRGEPRRGAALVAWAALALALAAGIYGKPSWYPLRWSDAYASTHPFAAALALNPVLFLADTWDNRRPTHDPERVRAHYDEVAAYLGVERPDREALRFERVVPPREVARRPNVVVIVLESMAAFKTGMLGNPNDPTPNLDALAEESLLFTRFFVPSGPTARSIFGFVTGVPDVNAAHAASRNPLVVRQPTLMNAFQGYEKMYFLGGSASWGNIRGVLDHNVPDLRLYEEGSYDSPRVDAWGISDLDLLREAHAVFRAEQRPFVACIQTSGSHRPFTIPEDRGQFEPVAEADPQRLFESGFDDTLAEYNSVRFMDYAVGEFFRLARQEPYYGDTVFFLFGDHGTSFPGPRPPLPGLEANHVPLVVHGPAFLPPPARVDAVASSLDVLPTAVGLTGLGHVNRSLGRDLLAPPPAPGPRYAFVRTFPDIGLVDEEHYLRLLPGGERRLFRYTSDEPTLDVAAEHPDLADRMERLCRGLYETALYLLHARGRDGP